MAGDLLDFELNSEDNRIIRANMPQMITATEGIWEKKDVDKLEIFPEEHRITFDGQNYQYTDGLCVMPLSINIKSSTQWFNLKDNNSLLNRPASIASLHVNSERQELSIYLTEQTSPDGNESDDPTKNQL